MDADGNGHRNGTYGGVTHPKYNDSVADEFERHFAKQIREGKKISGQEMKDFIDNKLRNARRGTDIRKFNDAIEKQREKFTESKRRDNFPKDPSEMSVEELRDTGRQIEADKASYSSRRQICPDDVGKPRKKAAPKTSKIRHRLRKIGQVAQKGLKNASKLSGPAAGAVVALISATATAADGPYQNALKAIDEGNVDLAQRILTDPNFNGGLIDKLIAEGNAHMALAAQRYFERIFSDDLPIGVDDLAIQ